MRQTLNISMMALVLVSLLASPALAQQQPLEHHSFEDDVQKDPSSDYESGEWVMGNGKDSKSKSSRERPAEPEFSELSSPPRYNEGDDETPLFTSLGEKVKRDTITPYWKRHSYAEASLYGMLGDSDVAMSGAGLIAEAFINMFSPQKQKETAPPVTTFRLKLGIDAFIGSANGMDTISVIPSAGVEFFDAKNLDGDTDDLIFRVGLGVSYGALFGQDDLKGDQEWSIWGYIWAKFASWNDLGGLHPDVRIDISHAPRSQSYALEIAVLLEVKHDQELQILVGPLLGFSQRRDVSRNVDLGIGVMAMLDHTFEFGVDVVYRQQTLGVNKYGWLVMATAGMFF